MPLDTLLGAALGSLIGLLLGAVLIHYGILK